MQQIKNVSRLPQHIPIQHTTCPEGLPFLKLIRIMQTGCEFLNFSLHKNHKRYILAMCESEEETSNQS
jgi:hypothetical protein